ncbi:MAG TPA: hypothetical protein VNZ45_18970, partial [Bacteroidia bacterium]|nr:hypothetical protein [Bacteroidia bacterium]
MKKYTLISPDGKRHKPYRLKELAKQYGMHNRDLENLAYGKRGVAKGWYSTSPKSKKLRKQEPII